MVAAGVVIAVAVIVGPTIWTIGRIVLEDAPTCASMDGGWYFLSERSYENDFSGDGAAIPVCQPWRRVRARIFRLGFPLLQRKRHSHGLWRALLRSTANSGSSLPAVRHQAAGVARRPVGRGHCQ